MPIASEHRYHITSTTSTLCQSRSEFSRPRSVTSYCFRGQGHLPCLQTRSPFRERPQLVPINSFSLCGWVGKLRTFSLSLNIPVCGCMFSGKERHTPDKLPRPLKIKNELSWTDVNKSDQIHLENRIGEQIPRTLNKSECSDAIRWRWGGGGECRV